MCRDRLPSFVDPQAMNRWAKRLLAFILAIMLLVPLVVIPIGGSFLITNGRIRLPERNAIVPEAVGLSVNDVEFSSSDGVTLRGWWDPGESGASGNHFSTRVESIAPGIAEACGRKPSARLWCALIRISQSCGESADAYTTLGVNESLDVCAAVRFIDSVSPGREKIFLGRFPGRIDCRTWGGTVWRGGRGNCRQRFSIFRRNGLPPYPADIRFGPRFPLPPC